VAHPEHTARHIAHEARRGGSCANDTDRAQPGDCPSLPPVLAELWAGKARIAAATRAAAALPLNELDRRALDLGADT
jgi:hypothetical protein